MGDNNILSLRFLMMWQSWIPTITTLQVWLHLLCLPPQRVHVAVRCLWTTRSPRSNKLKKLDMCHRCPPTKMSWTLQDVVKAGLWLKYYHRNPHPGFARRRPAEQQCLAASPTVTRQTPRVIIGLWPHISPVTSSHSILVIKRYNLRLYVVFSVLVTMFVFQFKPVPFPVH